MKAFSGVPAMRFNRATCFNIFEEGKFLNIDADMAVGFKMEGHFFRSWICGHVSTPASVQSRLTFQGRRPKIIMGCLERLEMLNFCNLVFLAELK